MPLVMIYIFITSVSILRLGEDILSLAKLPLPGGHCPNMVEFTCVAAVGPDGQLGEKNELPWPAGSIRGDMNYFKKLTMSNIFYSETGEATTFTAAEKMSNVVIMGRKTWDSIPEKFKPLESRLNIIITSSNIYIKRYFYSNIVKYSFLAMKYASLQVLKKPFRKPHPTFLPLKVKYS